MGKLEKILRSNAPLVLPAVATVVLYTIGKSQGIPFTENAYAVGMAEFTGIYACFLIYHNYLMKKH